MTSDHETLWRRCAYLGHVLLPLLDQERLYQEGSPGPMLRLWPWRADGPCGKSAPPLPSPPRIDGPPSFHARVLRRALGTDRCRAPPDQEDGLRPQDPAPGAPAGDDRAPGSTRPQQRPDRRRNPPARGHRAPLARPIRGRPGARPWPTASGRGSLRRSSRCRSPKSRR